MKECFLLGYTVFFIISPLVDLCQIKNDVPVSKQTNDFYDTCEKMSSLSAKRLCPKKYKEVKTYEKYYKQGQPKTVSKTSQFESTSTY